MLDWCHYVSKWMTLSFMSVDLYAQREKIHPTRSEVARTSVSGFYDIKGIHGGCRGQVISAAERRYTAVVVGTGTSDVLD